MNFFKVLDFSFHLGTEVENKNGSCGEEAIITSRLASFRTAVTPDENPAERY